MHDDDSRGLESPARANAPPTTWIELTAFQRDCLEAVTRLERTTTPTKRAITDELERTYPRVDRIRLEQNLASLVGRGLLATRDREPPAYRRTDAGRALLIQRAERLADACEIGPAATDRGTAAPRERGEHG